MGPWAVPLLFVASLLLTGRYVGEERILAAHRALAPASAQPRSSGRAATRRRSSRCWSALRARRAVRPRSPPDLSYQKTLPTIEPRSTTQCRVCASPSSPPRCGRRHRRPGRPGPRHAEPAVRHRELVRPPRRARPQRARRGRHQDPRRLLPRRLLLGSSQARLGLDGEGLDGKLATPVPSADGDITEEVAKITWRANSKSDWIAAGLVRGVRALDADPEHARRDAVPSRRARRTATARSSTGTAPRLRDPRRPSTWSRA